MALGSLSNVARMGRRGYFKKPNIWIRNASTRSDRKWRKILHENSSHFFQQTTFHGLKFVGDSQLSVGERVFFGISFVIAFVVCLIFMERVYEKWSLTPVLISTSPSMTPIDHLPFPAITICNMNQALASKVKFLDRNSTEYSILETFCNRNLNATNTQPSRDWVSYRQFLLNISQSCQTMLLSCKFGSVKRNCSEIFKPIITEDGVCCVFNMVHTKYMFKDPELALIQDVQLPKEYEPVYWSPEKEYPTPRPKCFSPQTITATGVSMGLTLILKVDQHEYFCSSSNGFGFRLSTLNPVETPQVKETGTFIKTGEESLVRMTAYKMEADASIRGIDIKDRQCVFENERNLSFFNVYTQMNCMNECTARAMYEDCDCIPFHMPRIVANATICGYKDYKCIQAAKLRSNVNFNDVVDCSDNCTASCDELSFYTDTVTTHLGHDNKFTIQNEEIANFSKSYIKDNIAVAHFFFRAAAFRGEKKHQFIGLTDFLSSTGGLMGLFLGFSFISIVELIYYITIRPCTTAKRHAKKLLRPVNKVAPINEKMNPLSKYYKERLNEYMLNKY